MKTKFFLSILALSLTLCVFAQKPIMELTFTADSNGQYVPLNSILIENLTQGGDTTLYSPDTVLVLDYITGIGENETIGGNDFSVSQNYPNPIEGKSTVRLYLQENENVLITVSDIMGRELIYKEYQLDRGNHSFTFFSGRESIFILTARINHQSRTIKMLNSSSHSSISGTCKLEYNGQQTGFEEYRSGNNLNNFVFNLGDLLKFTASSSLGERTLTSSPTGDQTYYFHYTGDPCQGTPTVNDIDGNTYNTVQIGDQCWLKENLKTTKYNNGTPIPNVTDFSEWQGLLTGAYVWYDNDIAWKEKYGALYNWFASIDSNVLCPTGWHVPDPVEWGEMIAYIGGTSSPHGNELKSCRQVNSPLGGNCNTNEHPRWDEDVNNGNYGTDDYGFSGLPGGYRDFSIDFGALGAVAFWWMSEITGPFAHSLWYNNGGVINYTSASYNMGFSVRCLKDD